MAVSTTTVQGTIYGPGGSVIPGGKITFRLGGIADSGVVVDGAVNTIVHPGPIKVTIPSTGIVSFTLIPNDAITPTGSHWRADFESLDGFTWREFWQVDTIPDPVEIGDITRVNP